ncbi:MAG: hypothetical protein Q4D02_08260 [Clostridia bacterium]|nr:hypothetical protein [Clostridia bacterium]
MPKKIKKKEEKRLGSTDESEKISKAQKGIIIVIIIGLLIMFSIGLFVFIRDRGYQHSDNKFVRFSYSEGFYNEGYDVYEVEVQDDGIFSLHNLGIESKNIEEKWSRTKYLNFNEELYDSGALEFETLNTSEEDQSAWEYRLEIYFENGETFVSYGMGKHPENTDGFKELIKKYFDSDIEL